MTKQIKAVHLIREKQIKEENSNIFEGIGNIDSEVGNWTSWIVKDEYYIIPLNDEKYNWALFRISWDDNWETWNWSFDARLSGYRND